MHEVNESDARANFRHIPKYPTCLLVTKRSDTRHVLFSTSRATTSGLVVSHGILVSPNSLKDLRINESSQVMV